MKRILRTNEELREIYREFPEMESLKDSLEKIDNIVIQPDGTGQCVFKVYLEGRSGPNEQLIRLLRPVDETFIAWVQDLAGEQWKELWKPHVRNPNRRWGSKVKKQTSPETIIRIVEEFARYCFPLISPKAIDIEEPPARVETITNRIVRDTRRAQKLKSLHDHRCQICKDGYSIVLPDGSKYSEAHHIKPLGAPHHGCDIDGNILVLCPNHHAMCDLGAIRLELNSLRSHRDHQIDRQYIDYHNSNIFLAE